MSSGLPYLQKQVKPKLISLAEKTSLQGFKSYNKSDLATALDDELRANQSRYGRINDFAEYYQRMAATPRKAGRAPKSESSPSQTTTGRSRRRTTVTSEESEASTDREEETGTPARSRSRPALLNPPASPAVLADAVDRNTAIVRDRLAAAWHALGMTERSNTLRDCLSSVQSVSALILGLEGLYVMKALIPIRYLLTVPEFDSVRNPEISIRCPDFFVLVESVFWAPYSLWLLTSLLLPLGVAYFFNLSLKMAGGAGMSTRSRRAQHTSFDPLSFHIAKALIAYAVYSDRFDFGGLYSMYSVAKVNDALPGHWAGVLTGSVIGVVGTLYEAILRK